MKLGRIILSAVLAASCIFGTAGCSGSPKSSVGNVEELTFVDGDKIAEITIEGYGTVKAKLFPDLAPKGVENFIMLAEQGYYDGLKIHRVLSDMLFQGGSLNGDGTGGKALINEGGVFDIETSAQARHFYGALCYANDYGDNSTQFYVVNAKAPQDITKIDTAKLTAAAATNTELKASATEGTDEYRQAGFKEKHYTNLAAMLTEVDEKVTAKYAEAGGYPMLDGGYTVFGQVYDGFDVIDAISTAEVTLNAAGEKSKPVTDIIISSVKIVTYKAPTTGEASDEAESSKDSSAAEESGADDSSDVLDTIEANEDDTTPENGNDAESAA